MTLTDLINKMNGDKEFETKYRELDSVDAFMEQAAGDGYSITAKDVETLRSEEEYHETGRAELPDEMMEAVAGGTMAGLDSSPSWLRSLFNRKQDAAAPLPHNTKDSPKITTLLHTSANATNITTLPAKLFPDEIPNARGNDIKIC